MYAKYSDGIRRVIRAQSRSASIAYFFVTAALTSFIRYETVGYRTRIVISNAELVSARIFRDAEALKHHSTFAVG